MRVSGMSRVLGFIIVALAMAAIPARAWAQEAPAPPRPLASLKTVPVPEPSNLIEFIRNRPATIALGKALFWDMQVGSDGVTACASCHFNAGADSRPKNQISPGLLRVDNSRNPDPDTTFDPAGPNRLLAVGNFPFHRLRNVNDRNSGVIFDTNDVASSQGVFNTEFVDVVPGNPADVVNQVVDPVFQVAGVKVRRVEPRNSPTVINAVFNFRNFWDGRAQNIFNGVNPFGRRDAAATLYRADNPAMLQEVPVSLRDSSLASQAVGPPLSSFEMSADGRTFQEIGDKFGSIDHRSESSSKGRKLPRKLAKKILPLRPLGRQVVHAQDGVLGPDSRAPQPGLATPTYTQLIQAAFQDKWWQSTQIIIVAPDGSRTVANRPDRVLSTDEYELIEYNFSLFFGLAVQMYQATLVSDDSPLDRYLEGNAGALTAQQKQGLEVFRGKGRCINCHGGAETTNASVANVRGERIERMIMGDNQPAVYDNGFYNIGVRPTFEDLGVGDNDPFGKPLSEARVAQAGLFQRLLGEAPNVAVGTTERVAADGAFKTPGLRNVELTAPYFHNGGQLTLMQVVEFYNRGGDRRGPNGNDTTGFPPNASNLDADIRGLGLTSSEKSALVAFMRALTDARVLNRKAPFDHPQLFLPNGHPGNQVSVTDDGTGKATDAAVEISAVGRSGGAPLSTFGQNLAP